MKVKTQEDRQFFIFEFWWRQVKRKTRLSAKPFLSQGYNYTDFDETSAASLQLAWQYCENKFYLRENKKITFISMAAHFASLWNRGLRRLGNGLLFIQPLSGEHHGGTLQVT